MKTENVWHMGIAAAGRCSVQRTPDTGSLVTDPKKLSTTGSTASYVLGPLRTHIFRFMVPKDHIEKKLLGCFEP